jgi:hypothetical protein
MAAGSQAAAAQATAAAAAAKAKAAATPTKVATPAVIAKPATTTTPSFSQTLNLYGTPATNAKPVVNTKVNTQPGVGKSTGATNTFIPGYTPTTVVEEGGPAAAPTKTIVGRIPITDKDGNVIGYTILYSDGTQGYEPNPDYQATIDAKGTTNINVIKALLLSSGLPASLVDASIPFLQSLIKDGLDAQSAVDIYLNSKDFTTKDGKTMVSPFYTQYGFYNDKLAAGAKYDPKDLFNAVEGYKTTSTKYSLDPKFTSTENIQNLLTNKWSVALFDQEANKARLAAINADPTYVATLKQLNFISGNQDLTDFFMDSTIGVEKMKQNFNTVAFAQEAIRRANEASQITFDKATAEKYGAQLTLQGMTEGEVTALASQGYQTIAQALAPETKYSGIYERENAANAATIQAELEAESFKGLESERKKRLAELATRSFQASPGITTQSLSTGMYQA